MGSSRVSAYDYLDFDESDVHVRPNKKGSRPRTKDRPAFEHAIRGRVVTVDRGRWSVVVDEGTEQERQLIAARAKELRRTSIVTGDFVDLVGDTSGAKDTLARIVRLGERSSVLRRSADDTDPSERVVVANADQLVIVVAAANPEPRTGFIDRAIVAALDAGIEPILCITKTDVKQPTELLEYYRTSGLKIVLSGSVDGRAPSEEGAEGLSRGPVDELLEQLLGHVSVLLGHSGVGKSTLVNALTGAQRATGHVNAVTGRGRHTSSSALALQPVSEEIEIPAGTWIIDTPGIRSFGLAHVSAERIVEAFVELAAGAADCPKGCDHSPEAEQCGLSAYVAAGRAGDSGEARLESLRKLLQVSGEQGDSEKELGSLL
ncbi:MAG: ribosome small subunit-dependent GTPase A [Rothia sp. (in: high G+C Gram-positive bacteria)]|uniref:ribosome small subunit-dependent GTPase A n=1 Tax=Rothia sp. (in: high G+C Gram-positive bacteria) TaxID=1885016 RepID=UPI0026DEF23B|nr:ribosome small subunit-dependent GTPase A [Rothia sp. (in: high G+C Gram-positive bacteria)]MDO5750145.1 ribosome small subunit-dependent GTPase A [Rothia sp. (in: high G+C Gram-positive bacteria)]